MSGETAAQTSVQLVSLLPIIAAYVFSGVTVCMFGINEFCKPTPTSLAYTRSVIAQAAPDELTSERDFLTAWVVYVFGLLALFFVLSYIGEFVFPALGLRLDLSTSKVVIPVVAAFCLVGFMPNMPMLKQMEQWWRDFMHRRASIPGRVNAIVEDLHLKDFSYDQLPPLAINTIIRFGEPGEKLEALNEALRNRKLTASSENWLLISGLIHAIPIARANAAAKIGTRFINRHLEHFNSLSLEYRDLREKIQKEPVPASIDDLNDRCDDNTSQIGDLVENIKIFVACIIASRPDDVSLGEALSLLLFKNNRSEFYENKNKDEKDNLFLSLFFGLFTAFALFSLTPFLTLFFEGAWVKEVPDFPHYGSNLFSWLFIDQIKYPLLMFLALSYRHHEILRRRWFTGSSFRVRVIAYAKMFFVVAAITAPIDLICRYLAWTVSSGENSGLFGFMAAYPSRCFLSPILTAVFAVMIMFTFDRNYKEHQGSPLSLAETMIALLVCTLTFLYYFFSKSDFGPPMYIPWAQIVIFFIISTAFFLVTFVVARARPRYDLGEDAIPLGRDTGILGGTPAE